MTITKPLSVSEQKRYWQHCDICKAEEEECNHIKIDVNDGYEIQLSLCDTHFNQLWSDVKTYILELVESMKKRE